MSSKLEIKIGDIFNATVGHKCLLVHGCNAQGVMGSGIAKIVKDQHPFAYLAYKQAQRRYGLKLGQVIVWENDAPAERSIANVITQKWYGRDANVQYVDYDAVIVGLQAVVKYMEPYPEIPIHLPFIGGGLGGGDRRRLIAIFEAVFATREATLWIREDEQ